LEILYVSKLCSKKKFDELYRSCQAKPQQQVQKFHYLLVNGFAEQDNVHITAISDLPITRVNTKKLFLRSSSDIENKILFKYLPHLNITILGHIVTFFATFFATINWALTNKREKKYIICDVLNLTISVAAKIAALFLGGKVVAIVTDIPNFMKGYTKERKKGFKSVFINLYTFLSSYFLKQYDAYVILTEQMNRLVNPKNKPYIVIEGMVDYNMKDVINRLEDKYKEKVVIYAGALHEKYGVKKLIEAFMKVKINDVRLWLFGSGDLESEIKEYEKKDERIKFFGVIPNEKVIEKEIRATLLINPRPSDEEFTKYSFTSKNMEYMVSGTPVLTTKLSGMPEEYYKYIYLFEDETVEGIATTMECVLNLTNEELYEKGLIARKFVLIEKNNVIQAKQIRDMIANI
jgi:glycosyltransferase involved in cell wall biosynthesis